MTAGTITAQAMVAATGTPAAIAAHGAIGNLRSIALISTAGTVDFLCHPRLDSPSVFCALLDADKGGSFAIAPNGEGWTTRQIYIPDTNVLVTRFMDGDSTMEITDHMPITKADGPRSALVRQVRCIRGDTRVALCCAPRFDYGRDGAPKVALTGDAALFEPNQAGASGPLRLRGNVPLAVAEGAATAVFALKEGEQASFVLECAHELPSGENDTHDFVASSFDETLAFWQGWAAHSSYRGRWREHVMRSALVLKLLTSAEHGSIAAAATFGLPEQPGGGRNWDYRFCWIRDSAFTTFALMRLGYTQEARQFGAWLAERIDERSAGDLQILYRLDGGAEAPESPLAHLTGHGGATPVRIGNFAAG